MWVVLRGLVEEAMIYASVFSVRMSHTVLRRNVVSTVADAKT